MKAYKIVAGVVRIGEGVRLGLNRGQAAARAHKLTAVDGVSAVYLAAGVLDFRAGEIIGLEDAAVVGKAHAGQLVEATDDDLRAMVEQEKKANGLQRAAKDAARKRVQSAADSRAAVTAASEEARKAGHAEGFQAGQTAGYARGLVEGRAQAEAAASAAAEKAAAEAAAAAAAAA